MELSFGLSCVLLVRFSFWRNDESLEIRNIFSNCSAAFVRSVTLLLVAFMKRKAEDHCSDRLNLVQSRFGIELKGTFSFATDSASSRKQQHKGSVKVMIQDIFRPDKSQKPF